MLDNLVIITKIVDWIVPSIVVTLSPSGNSTE